jgi:DNA-binding beta-propeller fold protein YncE
MLAACGQDNAGGGGGFVMVPNCGQNGQVLSTDSTTGQLICKDLPAGTVSLPNCKPDIEAVTSDGKALFCTNRNNDTAEARSAIEQLNKVEMDITE